MNANHKRAPAGRRIVRHLVVMLGAAVFTVAFFLVLPLIQAISERERPDTLLREAGTAEVAPPDIPIEDKKEPEKDEEEPPKLADEAPPLDLAQLELALSDSFGGWGGGEYAIKLNTTNIVRKDVDALFSASDLDQQPRLVRKVRPVLTPRMRRKGYGQVVIIFVVDDRGRVNRAKISRATDPVFEKAALAAVSKWKFEPGRRNGKAVSARMRVPITFGKG